MKYFILITDGAGDYPLPDRDKKTPLQLADNPVVNELAHRGTVGRCRTIPNGMEAGSDVGHLSLLGYPPEKFHTGRAPLEAASMGIELADNDITFRGNIVTLRDPSFNDNSSDENSCANLYSTAFENLELVDHSSQDISSEEGKKLYDDLQDYLRKEGLMENTFMQHGVSYRGAFVIENTSEGIVPADVGSEPPHNIIGEKIGDYLPGCKLAEKGLCQISGNTNQVVSVDGSDSKEDDNNEIKANCLVSEKIREIMERSYEFLKNHPVNKARIERGLRPGNCLWIWGGGRKPALIPYGNGRKLNCSVISAVDLIKGIGILSGMKVVNVNGATGNKETNFKGKGEAAVEAFEGGDDLVFVHVEGPDECGHQGDENGKIFCLEEIDENILKPVLNYLKNTGERYKILVMPDHYTPLELRTHSEDPVPFVMYDSENERAYDETRNYTEESGEKGMIFENGSEIAEAFLAE
ncbi:2,3-bisphosphoglycerate-independent phosphoglycerate mutase [Anaerovoracaceae bacterium SGI.195]